MEPAKNLTRDDKLRLIESITGNDDGFFTDYSDELLVFATDADPVVRAAAVDRLWDYPSSTIIDTLMTLLAQETESAVRTRIVTAMGRYVFELEDDELLRDDDLFEKYDYTENAIPRDDLIRVKKFLIDTYADISKPVDERKCALESLAFSTDESVRIMIEDAYSSGEKSMTISAIFAMGRNGLALWSDALMHELANADRDIQLEAVRACGNAGIARAGRKIEQLTHSRDRETMLAAIWALGQTGWKDGFDRLNELSSNRDPEIRDIAETAMEEWFIANGEIDLQ